MKKLFLIAIIILISMQITSAQNNEKKVLRHVVLFGWKAGTDTSAINKIVSSFKALPSKIDLIKGLEYGTNNSPENLNNGLTHCFLLTFKTEADRNAYLIHPAHKQFGAALKPKPDYITVLDYWVEK
jgi:Na+/serine symporter